VNAPLPGSPRAANEPSCIACKANFNLPLLISPSPVSHSEILMFSSTKHGEQKCDDQICILRHDTQLTDFLITGFTRGSTTPGSKEPRRVAMPSMPSRRRPALKNASRFLKVFRTRYIESVLARLIIIKYRQSWGLKLRERSMSLSSWLPI
jgi:hypothetical protein